MLSCVCVFVCVCVCVCVCVSAIVLSMSTKFVNKEEIINSTRSEDSVTLRLSSLPVVTMKIFVLMYLFFLFVKEKLFLVLVHIVMKGIWLFLLSIKKFVEHY